MGDFKREDKYLVLKWADLEKYLKQDPFIKFDIIGYICDAVRLGRHKDGKKDNTYVVVNEDETYAEQVWQLIRKHSDDRNIGVESF